MRDSHASADIDPYKSIAVRLIVHVEGAGRRNNRRVDRLRRADQFSP